MSTSTLLELLGAFMVACVALWFVAAGRPSTSSAPLTWLSALAPQSPLVNCGPFL